MTLKNKLLASTPTVTENRAWELEYATYEGLGPYFIGTLADTLPTDFQFNSDGSRIYIVGSARDTIFEYLLPEPYNITNLSIVKYSFGPEVSNIAKIDISSDGSTLIVSNNTDTLHYYTLNVPFDVPSISYGGSVSFSAYLSTIKRARLDNNGSLLHILDGNNILRQFSLSVPNNITNSTFVGLINFGSTKGSTETFTFRSSTVIGVQTSIKYYDANLPNSWVLNDQFSTNFNQEYSRYNEDIVKTSRSPNNGYVLGITNSTTLTDYSEGTVIAGATVAGTGSGTNILGNIISLTTTDGILNYLLLSNGAETYITPLKVRDSTSTIAFAYQGNYVGGFQSVPLSLYYKADGTGMYFSGSSPATVRSITFSIPNSFYTAVINSSASIQSPSTIPSGIFFKPDGTNLYLTDDNTNICYEYSLSTPWDIATASRTNKDYNFSTGAGISPRKTIFSPDGTKVFVSTNSNRNLYQYSLNTAWDLTTLNNTATILIPVPHTGTTTTGSGMSFDNTGTKLFKVDSTTDYLYGYKLQNPWDLSARAEDYKVSVIVEETSPRGVTFNTAGTKMYVLGSTGDDINNYNLSVPWKVDTASLTGVFSVATQTGVTPSILAINNAGNRMYVLSETNDAVYVYSTSAVDVFISGVVAAFSTSIPVGAQETLPTGMSLSPDNTRIYIIGTTTKTVYEYILGNFGNPDGTYYSGNNVNLSSIITNPRDIHMGKEGTRLYVIEGATTPRRLYQFNLSTAYDLSTAAYATYYEVPPLVSSICGVYFKPDGTAFFTVDATSDHVFKYLIG